MPRNRSVCRKSASRRLVRAVGRRLSSLARRQDGVAAVEFALVAPVMILLWIGGVEVTQALSVDRKVTDLASSTGDLVARWKTLTYADVENIFDIAEGVMYPYDGSAADMVITAVDVDSKGNATVAWSRARGSHAAYDKSKNVTAQIDANLRVPNSQIIMSEAYYTYTPSIGYVITGSLHLASTGYFVPRLTNKVELCNNNSSGKICS
ncbi:TadE/TadG family type IV pilus assembly protein [Propylenella binzhouense]|uniref:Pilus assembly protein n=1 Tax=Propylenella binzhouense TaxID=2555902 RepID=A0A964WU51_9HYPH|nr:TadE/TadG family type IV pilus assembly protein [Propylenella binzhouense]MYZ48679.1 pilus assembly protein [Propylenella binzhouense]